MLIQADARSIPLRDGCVQCCVTSPPYWGLRDYGVEGQLGLQQTPEQYVSELADVFDEVRRVLTDDGCAFVNLGDSYQNAKGQAHGVDPKQPACRHGLRPQDVSVPGLKPKDLVGVPWMFAFEARRRGWYLRSEIIWAKGISFCDSYSGSVMPESVQDRPTRGHEHVFLLTKSARYYYDTEAVKERGVYPAGTLAAKGSGAREGNRRGPTKQDGHGRRHAGFNARWDDGYAEYDGFRNLRSVWAIGTEPQTIPHFAIMPERLVEPCVLAGSRFGDRVLDPFSGSGTVARVAERLGRRWVGLDLNPAYHQLAKKRTAQRGLRFEATA